MNIQEYHPFGLPATLTWHEEDEADDLLLAIEQELRKTASRRLYSTAG